MAPDDLPPDIPESTFHSIEFVFTVKNLTSRTELKKGTPIRLCEWLEQGFVLELPYRSCGQGHSLHVEILASLGDQKHPKFEANCKVEELDHNDDATDRVVLHMVQYDKAGWQKLRALYDSRQEEVLKFLASVRGYD
jgi:hypothetical protein